MKYDISKEWCEKMAELEGDSEITAGVPTHKNIEWWIEEAKKKGLVDVKFCLVERPDLTIENVMAEIAAMVVANASLLDFNDSYRKKDE